jgi:hypothetical protein
MSELLPFYSEMFSFRSDIDDIAKDLINAFGLTFTKQGQHLCSPLLRWLDFRLRYIDPRPRNILKSDGFDARTPNEAIPALNAFIKLSETGADLNPYQTKTIKSNKSRGKKFRLRTDNLWADWMIHHVHLTEVPLSVGDEFSERSGWLLFFLTFFDHLALIDVRHHQEDDLFFDYGLIESVIKNWPEFAERFRIKLVLSPPSPRDTEAIKQLRRMRVLTSIEVDGHSYMPFGFGLSTALTSMKAGLHEGRVIKMAYSIMRLFADPDKEPMKMARKKGVSNPIFSLRVLFPQGWLAIVCEEAKLCWPFSLLQNSIAMELEDILLPSWASAKLIKMALEQKPNL